MKTSLRVTDFSDEALWLEFKAGNSQAFAEMYRRYIQVLYSYCYKITSDAKLIEDSIQDLFIYLWKIHQGLGDTTSIKFYLFKSLRREIIRKLTTPLSHERIDTEVDYNRLESVFFLRSLPDRNPNRSRTRSCVARSLAETNQTAMRSHYLRFYNNFSYQEIGDIRSLNYQSVCNLIYKALHTLKDNMAMKLLAGFNYWLLAVSLIQVTALNRESLCRTGRKSNALSNNNVSCQYS